MPENQAVENVDSFGIGRQFRWGGRVAATILQSVHVWLFKHCAYPFVGAAGLSLPFVAGRIRGAMYRMTGLPYLRVIMQ